jgi:hypothetical protein
MSLERDSVDEALRLLQGDDHSDRLNAVETQIAKIDTERKRLSNAIATGGQLEGLLEALGGREKKRADLEAERASLRSASRLKASDVNRVRDELLTMTSEWRQILADDPANARPIVSSLLKGRVTFTPPSKPGWWQLRGDGHPRASSS